MLPLLAGARSLAAQGAIEWQAHALVRSATTSFVGGGLGVALRAPGRERFSLSVTAGSLDGAFAGRGELLVGFYLTPGRRQGWSPYAAGGVALEVVQGGHQGNVVLTLGVESRPATATGWFLEAGVGGGVRGAVGFRWRHRR